MKKISISLLLIFLFSIDVYSQEINNLEIKQAVIKNGIGLAIMLAIVISWNRNKSILLTIINGIFSGVDVLYYIIIKSIEKNN